MAHILRPLKFHVFDWILLISLGGLDVLLNIINPFHRFVGNTMLNDLMYPIKDNTIPFWAVPIMAIGIPLLLFFVNAIRERRFEALHHAVLGLLFAVLLAAIITDAIKDGIGQPRPDFFWRCFPDGIQVFNETTGDVICHGLSSVIREGYKSFPSGHSSWSFAGLGFLSLHLGDRMNISNSQGRVGKLVIVMAPLMLATFVAISRIDDYLHRWQDVFVGALIGLGMAFLCHKQFFPSYNRVNGWVDTNVRRPHPSAVPNVWIRLDDSEIASSGNLGNNYS